MYIYIYIYIYIYNIHFENPRGNHIVVRSVCPAKKIYTKTKIAGISSTDKPYVDTSHYKSYTHTKHIHNMDIFLQ